MKSLTLSLSLKSTGWLTASHFASHVALHQAFPRVRINSTSSGVKVDIDIDLIRWGGFMPRLERNNKIGHWSIHRDKLFINFMTQTRIIFFIVWSVGIAALQHKKYFTRICLTKCNNFMYFKYDIFFKLVILKMISRIVYYL